LLLLHLEIKAKRNYLILFVVIQGEWVMTKDTDKTKAQLLAELDELGKKVKAGR